MSGKKEEKVLYKRYTTGFTLLQILKQLSRLMIFNDFQQNEHDLRFRVDSSVETVLFLFVTNFSHFSFD